MTTQHPLSTQVERAHCFFLKNTPASDDPVAILFGGREYCRADYEINRRKFDFHCLEWVVEGKGALTWNGRQETLGVGHLFVYGPDTDYVMRSHPTEKMVKYFIVLDGNGVSDFLQRYHLEPGQLRLTSPHPELPRLLNKIIEEGNSAVQARDICRAYLEIFLLKATREMTVLSRQDSHFQEYLEIRTFIEAQCLTLNTLDDIAERLRKSKFHICRLFKKHSMETAYQLLLRLKMNHAANLLITRDLQINELAESMHFDDPFHFSRVFKKVYGLSPANFKKQYLTTFQ